jgi:hypothetical protein
MAKVPMGLFKHTDLQEAMEIYKRTCIDLGQHDRCAATKHRVSILKFVVLIDLEGSGASARSCD